MLAIQRNTETILHLQVLGSAQLSLDRNPVVPRTRKMLTLLAYLAIQGGEQPREHLADLFWPDADIEDARASLRTALSYLRQALGSQAEAFLITSRDTIGLSPSAPLDLDVQALAQARQLLRNAPEPAILRRQIESAVERYRGPFLDGMSLPDAPEVEAWLEGQRAHWRGVVAELLNRLATLQIEDANPGAAITTLERWTLVDPDEELAWQRLIDLHLRNHDYAGARRAWKTYREVLVQLEAQPGPEMAVIAERLDGAGPIQPYSPAPARDDASAPDARTLPFVGRAGEWASLFAAFERTRRGRPEVVVLEAGAGMGKTRLISEFLAVAREAGADVIAGRALELESELPYAAAVDALRTRLEAENAPDDLLGDLWLGELARLVPELHERYPDLPVGMDDPVLGRGRLFEAVARLGRALAERKPLVLCLDDAQWVGVSTRDLVRYAAHTWTEAGTPVLIILSVRSESLQAEGELVHWLEGLEREMPAVWLALEALEPADVEQLVERLARSSQDVEDTAGLRESPAARFGTWLAGRTGGHPDILARSVRALLEHDVLRVRPLADGAWAVELPEVQAAERYGRLEAAISSRLPAFGIPPAGGAGQLRPHALRHDLPRDAPHGAVSRTRQPVYDGGKLAVALAAQ